MNTRIERSSSGFYSPLPSMVLRGTFCGSILVCFLCCILTTGNSTLDTTTIAQAAAPENTPQARKNKDCKVSPQYPESITKWCNLITAKAKNSGLSPDLLAAIIWQESGGNPLAYSSSGAVGLMQVMPRDGIATRFTCVNGPCFANRPTIEELQDPDFNVNYGAKMLAGLVDKHGNIRDALKSYGPMDVGYYYADKVLSIYNQYKK